MKRLSTLFFTALVIFYASSATAQTCNSASGFLKAVGVFEIGDSVVFGPDCQSVQDGGAFSLTGQNNTWTGTNSFQKLYVSGGDTSPNTQSLLLYAGCIRPEQFGAVRDGVTDDTTAVILAANFATFLNLGLCLTAAPTGSGRLYATTAIQFGAGNIGAAGSTFGNITSNVLTVTRSSSIDISLGQTLSGTGIGAGVTITGFLTGTGQLGTYSVSATPDIGGTTITLTAPHGVGNLSGNVLTITSVSNGIIKKGQSISGGAIPVGTSVQEFISGSGSTGTYKITPAVATAINGQTIQFNSVSVASLPSFIQGDQGFESGFVAWGTIGLHGPYEKKFITIFDSVNNTIQPYQGNYGNFSVRAKQLYTMGLTFQGFNATASNIVSTASNVCGVNIIGNDLTPVIWAHFKYFISRFNNGCAYNITGDSGLNDYNVQAVDMIGMYGNQNIAGWIIDYAGFSCLGCESEGNVGSYSVFVDHSKHLEFIDFYTEGNGNQFTGTANSHGIKITGKLDDDVASGIMNDPLNGPIVYFNGISGLTLSNFGAARFTGTPSAPTQSPGDNSTKLATTGYVDAVSSTFAPLASPHFTGIPTAPTAAANNNSTQLATTAYVDTADALKANLVSPALTGNPTAPTQLPANNSTRIATTAYADAIAALKANLASPTFSGVPAAPTAAPGTNTTQLATTAYADAIAALKANLASPTFTGIPAAPTASPNTNTTQIATTAYADAIAALKANLVSPSFTTPALGVATATSINGVTLSTAGWTSYSPSLTCAEGGGHTIGAGNTLTGFFKVIEGKTTAVRMNLIIGAAGVGTCTQFAVSLPNTAQGNNELVVRDRIVTGLGGTGEIGVVSQTTAYLSTANGASYANNSTTIVVTGVYENQ